jgi:hypothetical protein
MQVSGSSLPVLSGYIDYSSSQQNLDRRSQDVTPERNPDTEARNRQQTVEYVFRGEFENSPDISSQQSGDPYAQAIDPANREAISTYNDIGAASINTARPARQGGRVNLYV